jgi:hypothetical protein
MFFIDTLRVLVCRSGFTLHVAADRSFGKNSVLGDWQTSQVFRCIAPSRKADVVLQVGLSCRGFKRIC